MERGGTLLHDWYARARSPGRHLFSRSEQFFFFNVLCNLATTLKRHPWRWTLPSSLFLTCINPSGVRILNTPHIYTNHTVHAFICVCYVFDFRVPPYTWKFGRSPWKYTLTTKRSWHCTAWSSTTASSLTLRKTGSYSTFLTHLNSTRYDFFFWILRVLSIIFYYSDISYGAMRIYVKA